MTHPVLARAPLVKKYLLSVAGLMAIAASIAVGLRSGDGVARAAEANAVEMRHYRNDEWKFELDVPRRWTVMPPLPTESRAEIMRFWSYEKGNEGLIVFRRAYNPKELSPEKVVEQARENLAKGGLTNFVSGETTIGSKRVLTLDFTESLPDGGVMNLREYFIFDGTLRYTLRFGTPHGEGTLKLFDRMAKSFDFENS